MKKLLAHHKNPNCSSKVEILYNILESQVHIEFFIHTAQVNTNDTFLKTGHDNYGLWDYDVAEVFLQGECPHDSYLELQCSPLGQKFALIVEEPRKKTKKPMNLKTKFESRETETGFYIKFIVPATDIPGGLTKLRGNFTACLGKKTERSYFALNINSDELPDFHKPELFQNLENK
jgi:hypothetical protein